MRRTGAAAGATSTRRSTRPATAGSDQRQPHIAEVLTGVAGLARRIAVARQAPFQARRLSRNQVEALFVLAHSRPPVTPGSLVAALGVTAGAVSQLLDSLRTQGLVEVAAHPQDGRSRLLRLTDSARAEIDTFEKQVVADLAPIFDELTTSQLRQLAALLSRLPLR